MVMKNKLKTYRIRVKLETSTTFLVDAKNKINAVKKLDSLLNNINCFNPNIFNEDKKFYYNICEFDTYLDK